MDETQPTVAKSRHKKKDFQYSENGQKQLQEKLDKITLGVYKSAESKAKSLAKIKSSIEVSEEHFLDAIDFVLKKGSRTFSYWVFRSIVTLLASFGGLVAMEGYRIFGVDPDKKAYLMISSGVLIAILAIISDKIIDYKS